MWPAVDTELTTARGHSVPGIRRRAGMRLGKNFFDPFRSALLAARTRAWPATADRDLCRHPSACPRRARCGEGLDLDHGDALRGRQRAVVEVSPDDRDLQLEPCGDPQGGRGPDLRPPGRRRDRHPNDRGKPPAPAAEPCAAKPRRPRHVGMRTTVLAPGPLAHQEATAFDDGQGAWAP
jgi:hypothetical protein